MAKTGSYGFFCGGGRPVVTRRFLMGAACVIAALAAACSSSGSTATSTPTRRPADIRVSTSSTSSTSAPPDERAAATAACRRWAYAGSEPDPSAGSDNAIQVDAAHQASAAALVNPQWRQLAEAMTEESGLPETGNTPAQEATGERDLVTIEAQCRLLGVTVP
jgi:predicted outer membrane protein